MNFCEKCRLFTEKNFCSNCGNENLREIKDDDFCFLTAWDSNFQTMLEEIFKQEDIPCAMIPVGNGVRTMFGLRLEKVNVYVPYKFYDRALDVLDLFGDDEESLREDLLQNFRLWHFAKESSAKKAKKNMGLSESDDILEVLKDRVIHAEKITDKGEITAAPEGRYLLVETSNENVMFNSATYEIISVGIKD